MRPIAPSHRQSSRAASSRHAVDAVVVGNPVPLGIPALFLADERFELLEKIALAMAKAKGVKLPPRLNIVPSADSPQ